MGLIRKAMSLSTLGLIDYRSDKERVARSARLTKRATKKQVRLTKKQNRILRGQTAAILMQPQQETHFHNWQPYVTDDAACGWYCPGCGATHINYYSR